MGILFFWLWIILIAISPYHFWRITILIIIFYLISASISETIKEIIEKYRENKKYYKMLRELMPQIKDMKLEQYQNILSQLENVYARIYRSQKIKLEDENGNAINICPKCGGYMKIIRYRERKFLGCSNYPNCKFSRSYNEIFKIKI